MSANALIVPRETEEQEIGIHLAACYCLTYKYGMIELIIIRVLARLLSDKSHSAVLRARMSVVGY